MTPSPSQSPTLTTDFLVGQSSAMQKVLESIKLYAQTDDNILITGETGTGKRLVAQCIHNLSRRCAKPFVTIPCPAVAESVFEAELLGYEKGAFTDAKESKAGHLETADGGVAFLDEIGEISPRIQSKLLDVTEEKAFYRVGGRRRISVDVRFISATNINLEAAVQAGRFRSDLYYRLNSYHIHLPPLRERDGDIALLAHHFLEQFNTRYQKQIKEIDPLAIAFLEQQQWPGNVRELGNLILRAATVASSDRIMIDDLYLALEGDRPQQNSKLDRGLSLRENELSLIKRALQLANGNKAEAARMLGIDRATLYRKIKSLGIKNS